MTRRKAILLAAAGASLPACLPRRTGPVTDQERYDKAIAALAAAKEPYARWCALGDAAKASLAFGKDAEAKTYAEELRALAPSQTSDWNYGNAIQDFHIVLGCLALKSGDVAAARNHLTEAGRSPGSPQMDSFGPNMTLAKALLDAGEREVVLNYFELCRKFWDMHRGKLDQWRQDVEAGRNPDFGANLVY